MATTYILQKDLPDIKAGAEGDVNEEGLLCFYETDNIPEYFFPIRVYENNPEWFKLKETKEEDMDIVYKLSAFINDSTNGLRPVDFTKLRGIDGKRIFYTEEDMRKCFNAARYPINSKDLRPIFVRFEDYIRSLNK